MHLKMPSGKLQPFCPSLNVLMIQQGEWEVCMWEVLTCLYNYIHLDLDIIIYSTTGDDCDYVDFLVE